MSNLWMHHTTTQLTTQLTTHGSRPVLKQAKEVQLQDLGSRERAKHHGP